MTNKLNMQDLIDLLTSHGTLNKEEAEAFISELFNVIEQGLSKDELVKIKDFGTFKLTPIQDRESVDVNTQEKIVIPAHRRVSFAPSQTLKNLVNKPFAHFETTPLNDGIVLENIEQNTLSENIENEEEEDFSEENDKRIEDNIEKADSPVENESENRRERTNSPEIEETDLANIKSVESENRTDQDSVEKKSDTETNRLSIREVTKKSKPNRKSKRPFLWIYISTALAIIFAIIFAYSFYNGKNFLLKEEIEESEIPKPVQETTPILKDSLSTPQPAPPVEPEETVEMIRGKTLRLIALDKFGSREFWIYIYLKNKDKIKNPDVVPVGLELVLPRKTEYAMDADNPEHVANAKKLGDEEMKKFW